MRGVWIQLDTVCIIETAYVAGKFNDGNLHSETEPQIWNTLFPCVACGNDHSLNTTVSEATRYKNTVHISQKLVHIVNIYFLGINPLNIDGYMLRDSAVF